MRFEDFSGVWQIERRIDDFRAGSVGQFEGSATYEPCDFDYHYSETGVLKVPGAAGMTAAQSYQWRRSWQGVEVFFADGRPFHFIDLSRSRPKASHDCPPDWYDVEYDFSDWPNWRSVWRVRGPRKDYEMTSHYARTD